MRAALALVLTLWASAALAFGAVHPVGMLNPQVAPIAGITQPYGYNFAAGGNPISNGVCSTYGHVVPCILTTTRASAAYVNDAGGNWTLVPAASAAAASGAAGGARTSNLGLLVEEARTNDALWARDMTDAAWVKVGMGTALNAVGIDGTANSATTLTATGTASSCTASCTALQTITLGSTSDTYSVFLKRVTGSGAVNITINNLVGTTACTLITTGFTRCSVNSTLANPIIGIQLTALNDVVIADFNQMEPGASVTSPIGTTTVPVTRAADVVIASNPPTFGGAYTMYAKGTPQAPLAYGTIQAAIEYFADGSNRTSIRKNSTTSAAFVSVVGGSGGNIIPTGSPVWTQNVSGKVAGALVAGDQAAAFSGSTAGNATIGTLQNTPTSVTIGSGNNGSSFWWNGFVESTAIAPQTRYPNQWLQNMTPSVAAWSNVP